MASATFKFDVKTPAAQQLVADVFTKLKSAWDDTLTDDSVAQYAVALAARGSDQKKLLNNLATVLGDAAGDVVEWLQRTVKQRRPQLTAAAPAQPAKAPAAAPAAAAPAPTAAAPSTQRQGPDDVEALLREGEGEAAAAEQEQEQEQPQARQASAHAAADAGVSTTAPARVESAPEHSMEQKGQPQQQPQAQPQQPQQRSTRIRSAIQWADPKGSGSQADGIDKDAEAAARRAARFGGAASARSEREGVRERSRSPVRAPDARSGSAGGRESGRDVDRERRSTDGQQASKQRLRSAVQVTEDAAETADGGAAPQPPKRLYGLLAALKSGSGTAPQQPAKRSVFDRISGGAAAGAQAAAAPAGRGSVFDRLAGGPRKRTHGSDDPDSPQPNGDESTAPSPSKALRSSAAAAPTGATAASALRQLASKSATNALQQVQSRMQMAQSMGAGVGKGPALGTADVQGQQSVPVPQQLVRGSAVLGAAVNQTAAPPPGTIAAMRAAAAASARRGAAPAPAAAKPAHAAAAKPVSGRPVSARPAASKPAAAAVIKPAVKPVVPVPEEVDEMAKLRDELKRKEMEIALIKQGMSSEQAAATVKHAHDAALRKQDADRRSVVVQGINPNATEQVLAAHFSICGTLKRVTILRNMYGAHAMAYLEYGSHDEACTSLSLSGSLFLGMPVTVVLKPVQPLASLMPQLSSRPAAAVARPGALIGPRPAAATAGARISTGNGATATEGASLGGAGVAGTAGGVGAVKKLGEAPPLRGKNVWRRSDAPATAAAAAAGAHHSAGSMGEQST